YRFLKFFKVIWIIIFLICRLCGRFWWVSWPVKRSQNRQFIRNHQSDGMEVGPWEDATAISYSSQTLVPTQSLKWDRLFSVCRIKTITRRHQTFKIKKERAGKEELSGRSRTRLEGRT
ncbi:unnamed protein product, partial [Tenebrio molitor]